jgi:hypothetical protein
VVVAWVEELLEEEPPQPASSSAAASTAIGHGDLRLAMTL